MALLNNGTPAAPPAPGVKSITGVGQQNSNISAAFSSQPNTAIPSQQIGAPKQPQGNGLGGQVGSGSITKPTVKPSTKAPAKPVKKMIAVTGPNANFQEQPDPRDSIYWQNVQALEATLGPMGSEMIALQGEQDRSDIGFDADRQQQEEYYRRRKRDLAESRLGTGSSYTGMARRDQIENTYGFVADMGRRNMDKANADAARRLSEQSVRDRYQAGLRAEEGAGAQRIYERLAAQAAEGKDPVGPVTGDKNATIRRQVKGTTKRIKVLRERLENSDSDAQKKRLENKIERLRKRRSKLQGKISGKS